MKKNRMPLWALGSLVLGVGAMVLVLADQNTVDRLLATTGIEKVLYPAGKKAPSLEVLPDPTVVPDLADNTTSKSVTDQAPPPEIPSNDVVSDPGPPSVGQSDAAEVPLPTTPNTYRLYFLKLSPEGRMDPVSFPRELPAGSTPLAATLKALLQGPTLQDKAQGALSLVPEGTKLLSVRLKDRTAFISMSEEFEHNLSGLEGLAGQLREVVWTATQFPSVDMVQILINGQYRDTLGEGGISIASPLTRSTIP